MISCFCILSVSLLFVNTNFTDTTAYVNFAQRFQNDQFLSFNGVNAITNEYKTPMMYFTYSVFFFDNIPSGFNYFNPILLNLFWLLILNDCL